MAYPLSFKLVPVAAVLATLAACGGSSSSSDPAPALRSQAVDGYIVGAEVFCDDVQTGMTRAAGVFTCPAGTLLSKISGGFDVGIDDVATTGDVPFNGVLSAPATSAFVTPTTTITVAMSQASDGAFDLSNYNFALADLAQTLGVSAATLVANPVVNTEAAKTNAKVHQVLVAFAPGVEDYEEATAAFASFIANTAQTGGSVSLTADVTETMAAINQSLAQANSPLAKAIVDLDQATLNVVNANAAIDSAESPAKVAEEAKKALVEQAPVTIDRSSATVSLYNANQTQVQELSIDEFENQQQLDGEYTARLMAGVTRISYDNDVFQFNQNINSSRVTVAFEIKAVTEGDLRSMSFVSDDVVVSAIKSRSDSLVISSFSEDATFEIRGTDSQGVVTVAEVDTDGKTLSSDGTSFSIDMERINRQLSDLGFEDMLSSEGDYKVTLVISGLRINERDGSTTTTSEKYTIQHGDDSVTGNGFRGYVSVFR